jgi:hypothetical protein
MEDVLPQVESSTLAKTNILLALILPKLIFIIHKYKVIVIIIYICVFIHKINKVSFNISCSPTDRVSSPISPYSQSTHPTILLSYRSHLIFQVFHHLSQKLKLLSESLHLKGFIYFRCRELVIFRHLKIGKNWLLARKIYPHNSHVSHNLRLFTQLFSLRLLPLGLLYCDSFESENQWIIVTGYRNTIQIYIKWLKNN